MSFMGKILEHPGYDIFLLGKKIKGQVMDGEGEAQRGLGQEGEG